MNNRRDFLRLAMGTLAGTMLSSCGSGGGGGNDGGGSSGTTLPNGFNYQPILTTKARQSALAEVAELTGGCTINARGDVLFYAKDTANKPALFEVTLNFSGATPTIASSRRVVREGEVLADGRHVTRIGNAVVNNDGNLAVLLTGTRESHDKPVPGAYFETNKGGLQPLVQHGDSVPGVDGQFGASFQDIDLHDNDDVLLVGYHSHGSKVHQSILFFPGANVANGKVVASSGDQTPQSDGRLQSFGIVDLHDNGGYVALVGSAVPSAGSANSRATMALRGNVNQDIGRAQVLTASRALGVSRAVSAGDAYYAPRIGGDGQTTHVVHVTNTQLELYYRGNLIAATGGTSPSGHVIRNLTPGDVHGRHGLCIYLLVTDAGLELCVSNGVDHKTVLSRGDTIAGKQVEAILYNLHNQQSDDDGRIVLVAEYTDGTHGLVLGQPV